MYLTTNAESLRVYEALASEVRLQIIDLLDEREQRGSGGYVEGPDFHVVPRTGIGNLPWTMTEESTPGRTRSSSVRRDVS